MRFSQYARGYAQVDLDAIISNAKKIKEHIKQDTRLVGVVKTDGYGHGGVPVAKALEKQGFMHGFAVATAEEAFALRDNGITLPILVLGYTFPESFEKMVALDIRPAVFTLDAALGLSEEGYRQNKKAKVHIKVDTGMGRIGIMPDENGFQYARLIHALPNLQIEGIFTHFARADEQDKTDAARQLSLFKDFADRVEREFGYSLIKGCSNSAAILEMPEADMDVVRAGILLYGLAPSAAVDIKQLAVKPALSLYSSIVYIKWLPAGTPVSYGGRYVTQRKTRVATIPIGYGDGYPRSLSENGYVLIRGMRAPILGSICMDQFMVDVTDIPEAMEEDRVTLIGRDGEEEITAEMLGELSGRFHYELICGIGKRIPRIYTGG